MKPTVEHLVVKDQLVPVKGTKGPIVLKCAKRRGVVVYGVSPHKKS